MSSPWAKIENPVVSLDDIMSEEVAKDLQSKEFEQFKGKSPPKEIEIPPEFLLSEVEGLDSDAEIAKMLQQQYDKEYDEMLKRTEDKVNGDSKVSISFSNYRRATINSDFESDSEEEELEDLRDRKQWDRFDTVIKDFASIPVCGYHKTSNGDMVTKHDLTINGRRNVCKMMSFPPEFVTGDGAGFDMKLSNKVYNSLKSHWKQEQARRHRIHDKKEDQATADFGVDEPTRLLLYKMINKQLLERVNGIINVGKEAVILHADSDPSYPECVLPKECVVKVFKTTLSEFKQRDKYIKDDFRFKNRMGKQTSVRKIVHLWAEKERDNLYRLRKAGLRCPEVVALKQHVLVMSFIGTDHKAAPKLKDAAMSDADYILAYDQVVEGMKSLYKEANLVHADLSEYNLLWHEGNCYFIDVSQSVEPSHENAFHFLFRDCMNVTNFFERKGVPDVFSCNDLFKEIVGVDYMDRVSLAEHRESFKMKPHLVDRPGFESTHCFENAWEKSTSSKPTAEMENLTIIDLPVA